MSEKVLEALKEAFGDKVVQTHSQFGDDTAIVDASIWKDAAKFLRDDPRCQMDLFVDLCGVDYQNLHTPRFEVVLHLRSIAKGHRIRMKTRVGGDDGENARVPSLCSIWMGANWFERETWDLMGIDFEGHPDLRRILMYPEFVGHPLRKDYPADRTQPLVAYRQEAVGKLPPFGPDEGMPFGRQTYDVRREDMGVDHHLDTTDVPPAEGDV